MFAFSRCEKMGRVLCIVALVVALASTVNAAALRDKEINLIRELAGELANDLGNAKVVEQAQTETNGMSCFDMTSFTQLLLLKVI